MKRFWIKLLKSILSLASIIFYLQQSEPTIERRGQALTGIAREGKPQSPFIGRNHHLVRLYSAMLQKLVQRNHCILVAEDDALIRFTFTAKLTRSGYGVFAAVDGLDALRIARKRQLDLLVTDLDMPFLSGGHLIERVTKAQPNIKVLVVSANAYDFPKQVRGSIEALRKPVDSNMLLSRVQNLLGA